MTEYEKGEWDMFELITSVWYGKQYYFLEDNHDYSMVYSRASQSYMTREEAYNEFINAIGE